MTLLKAIGIILYLSIVGPVYFAILIFEYLFPKTALKWFKAVKLIPDNLENKCH